MTKKNKTFLRMSFSEAVKGGLLDYPKEEMFGIDNVALNSTPGNEEEVKLFNSFFTRKLVR